jgi:CRP/FNR family cyclic AMP-dependent transcriptional regulator
VQLCAASLCLPGHAENIIIVPQLEYPFMERPRKARALKSEKANLTVDSLLGNIVRGKALLKRQKGAKLFSQGEAAEAIYFIQTGKVQLTVASTQGKKAVLGMMGPRDFLGEECLVGDSRRTSTATVLGPSTIFRIEKRAMLKAIHRQPEFSEDFVASLLARSVNMEEDLCDQLFNHSELRLACALLKLSRAGRHARLLPDAKVSGVTHKKLAEIVGTTPSKIIFFMNKFRKLGLIDYRGDGDVKVMSERLTDMVIS